MRYVVTAPYVTLRVASEVGGPSVLGFYAGALVPANVDAESLKRHLDENLVAEVPGLDAEPEPVKEPEQEPDKAPAKATRGKA